MARLWVAVEASSSDGSFTNMMTMIHFSCGRCAFPVVRLSLTSLLRLGDRLAR